MLKRLMLMGALGLAIWQPPVQAVVDGAQQQSLRQVTLAVRNMTCGMCKYTVENALKQVEGVKRAEVDMAQGIAVVVFDPAKVGVEALVKAVSDAGYPASVKP